MVKILLAVDGSESAVIATRKVVEMLPLYMGVPQIELVNVREPVPLVGRSGPVTTREMAQRYYKEESERAFAPSAQVLEEAGVQYAVRVFVGDVAEKIAQHALDSGCDMICIGTRGMTAFSNLVLGSTATKLIHLAAVPVLLVR